MFYISNFKLEINNLIIMKKTQTMLILVLAGAVTFSMGLWFYAKQEPLTLTEYAVAALVLIVVVFSAIVGRKRIRDEKRGLPAEDELSLDIKRRAAASAFMWSFYLWTLITVFTVDSDIRPELPLEAGLLGMGVLFVAFWVYYSNSGTRDADSH